MKLTLLALIAAFTVACAPAAPPITLAVDMRVADDAVWLSRVVLPSSLITVGGDETMKVLAFDGMRANGQMRAHVQRGTTPRHHRAGEVVVLAR